MADIASWKLYSGPRERDGSNLKLGLGFVGAGYVNTAAVLLPNLLYISCPPRQYFGQDDKQSKVTMEGIYWENNSRLT